MKSDFLILSPPNACILRSESKGREWIWESRDGERYGHGQGERERERVRERERKREKEREREREREREIRRKASRLAETGRRFTFGKHTRDNCYKD